MSRSGRTSRHHVRAPSSTASTTERRSASGANVNNPRSYKMKFTVDPYHALTFLRENAQGELSPALACRRQ